jgi:hypothetical protein
MNLRRLSAVDALLAIVRMCERSAHRREPLALRIRQNAKNSPLLICSGNHMTSDGV